MNTLRALAILLASFSTTIAAEVDLTGTWFDPQTPGWGLVIDDAPDEALVVYWFTYKWTGGPEWFLSVNQTLYNPEGTWQGLEWDVGSPMGTLEITPLGPNDLLMEWVFFDYYTCQPVMFSPVWSGCSGAWELTRITRVLEDD